MAGIKLNFMCSFNRFFLQLTLTCLNKITINYYFNKTTIVTSAQHWRKLVKTFTHPAWTFSLQRLSIILFPRSYMVSMSVVFKVSLPTLVPWKKDQTYACVPLKGRACACVCVSVSEQPTVPVAGLSIWISTTSPSIISVSSLVKNSSRRIHSVGSRERSGPAQL